MVTGSLYKVFVAGIVLNLLFVLAEALAGFLSGSLGLLSDAGHNLSDVLSLALAWGAAWLARRSCATGQTMGAGGKLMSTATTLQQGSTGT